MLGLDIAYMRAKFNDSSFSHSGNTDGAYQNLNGSRDLTTPLSGWFAIHGLALAMINRSTKFEDSISTHYEDMKADRKYKNGVVWVCYGSLKVTRNSAIR